MKYLGNLNKTSNLSLYFTLTIFLFANIVTAQNFSNNKYNLFFAEIGGSYIVPQGLFSSVDLKKSNAGLAKPGIGISAYYGFHSRINLGIKVGVGVNFFDFDKCVDTISDYLYIPSYCKEEIKYGRWWMTNFFVGPTYKFDFKDISFDISILTGISFSRRPAIKHKIYKPGDADFNPYFYRYMPGLGSSVVFKPELAVYYNISKKHRIKLFCSYQHTSPTINYQIIWGDSYHNKVVKDKSVKMDIKWLEFGLAILFKN